MSFFIRILCTAATAPRVDAIREFVEDGVFFENDPQFSSSGTGDAWEKLEIRYAAQRRPITVWNTSPGQLLDDELREIGARARELPPEPRARVLEHVGRTRHVIAFEIDRDRLTDDAWEMMDCLEAHLASTLGGIIYVDNEGFYDASLNGFGLRSAVQFE